MTIKTRNGVPVSVNGKVGTTEECCQKCPPDCPVCNACIITDENGNETSGWFDGDCVCRPHVSDPYDPASYTYNCGIWGCHAYTGECEPDVGGMPDDFSVLGSYSQACPACPTEPTHTLCCGPGDCGGNGPGPVPVHGLPNTHDPNQVMQPGETCEEYYTCDQTDIEGNGSCNYIGWFRSSVVGPTAVTDCDQCEPFCSAADCSYVLHGGAVAANDPSLVECSRCGWECDPVVGCVAVLDGAATCPTCIAFCDPAADCAFVAYAATAEDAGGADYEPCDACNPLP